MCCIQSVSDLNAEIQQGFDFQGFTVDRLSECLSLQQLHGDEGTLVNFVNFVNGANVGMVQSRCRSGFTAKPLQCLRIVGNFYWQKLQSDVEAKFNVFSLVHDTHATTTQLAQNAVMGDCLAHELGGSGHWEDGRTVQV